MNPKLLLKTLEESKVYKAWSKDNPGFYLVHFFTMTGQNPQIGYYNKDVDKIVTFELGREIVQSPGAEAFKNKSTIEELNLKDVHISQDEILFMIGELKRKEYSEEKLNKEMIILQKLDGKVMYNVTYFTVAFKTLNFKVDAQEGKIISHELSNLIGF